MEDEKFILGITGGVGAGKSTILDYLNRRNTTPVIIEADKVGHVSYASPARRVYSHIRGDSSGAGS